MKESLIHKVYEIAKERYAELGIDTEKVLAEIAAEQEAAKKAAIEAKNIEKALVEKKAKEVAKASVEKDLELLKKRKKQLYMKIYNDKKKGYNTTQLEKEHDEIVAKIKNLAC